MLKISSLGQSYAAINQHRQNSFDFDNLQYQMAEVVGYGTVNWMATLTSLHFTMIFFDYTRILCLRPVIPRVSRRPVSNGPV